MTTAKCLTCSRPPATAIGRGLCLVCYSGAKKMIETGKTTWDDLVAMGLALDKDGGDNFAQAFNKAMEGREADGKDATR